MRVLLIEDDSATAMMTELMLKSEGFNVYTTDLGEEGLDLGKIYDYDLILLDLNLPDMHGLDVLRGLRVAKIFTPVIIVSGTHDIDMKVKTFGAGADDYLAKPYHRDELVARAHAVIRRSKGHATSTITTGKIVVDLDAKRVEVDGSRIHLTGKEYGMLELLSLRKGVTLTKEAFLNHLYGGMDEPELKIIDVFICKLRRKLAAAGAPGHIQTVWGRGYVLQDETDAEPVAPEPTAETLKNRLDTMHGRILQCLAEGPAGVKELRIATGRRQNHIGAVMGKIFRQGWAKNVSRVHVASYELTAAGRAWLISNGYEFPADRAAAA